MPTCTSRRGTTWVLRRRRSRRRSGLPACAPSPTSCWERWTSGERARGLCPPVAPLLLLLPGADVLLLLCSCPPSAVCFTRTVPIQRFCPALQPLHAWQLGLMPAPGKRGCWCAHAGGAGRGAAIPARPHTPAPPFPCVDAAASATSCACATACSTCTSAAQTPARGWCVTPATAVPPR